ncbi:MAG: alanine racemase, partial [bacterium]|nr:alanine racemase [bacterium]
MDDHTAAALREALAEAGLSRRPIAVLDLDAVDANLAALRRRAAGKPIRVASKSLRVPRLLEHSLAADGFSGVLAYTLREALWLVENGVRDVVLGYPTTDRGALELLAADERALAEITLMADSVDHLDLIESAIATPSRNNVATPSRNNKSGSAPNSVPNRTYCSGGEGEGPGEGEGRVRVALELDAGWRPSKALGFGALRSPIHSPEDLAALAREVGRRPHLKLVGVMAYEGQVAGVADAGRGAYRRAVRFMKSRSTAELATRRQLAVDLVRQVADLEFVNGGGTGSLETTAREDAVTEVAAGSGIVGPGLFDGYTSFRPQPALHLGFQVARRPGPGVVTLMGGGWIASGPPGEDRLPTIAWPSGLRYVKDEAAG